MNQKILRYLADKILDDLRSHKGLPPDLADQLTTHAMAHTMRNLLGAKDGVWIKDMLVSPHDGTIHFALAIVRPLQGDPLIRSRLFDLWKRKDLQPRVRYGLIFSLLDFADLEQSMHDTICKWVIENREHCRNKDRIWYEGPDRAKREIQVCLESTKILESKKWIYLLEFQGLADEEEVRKVVTPYLESSNKFTSSVAKKILS